MIECRAGILRDLEHGGSVFITWCSAVTDSHRDMHRTWRNEIGHRRTEWSVDMQSDTYFVRDTQIRRCPNHSSGLPTIDRFALYEQHGRYVYALAYARAVQKAAVDFVTSGVWPEPCSL